MAGLVFGDEPIKNHQMMVVEIEGDAPNCFQVRCSCGWEARTHMGLSIAEEMCQRHWLLKTGIAVTRKGIHNVH